MNETAGRICARRNFLYAFALERPVYHVVRLTCGSKEERDNEEDEEYDKENLCDACGGGGDAAEAEYTGNDRENEECECPGQHDDVLI